MFSNIYGSEFKVCNRHSTGHVVPGAGKLFFSVTSVITQVMSFAVQGCALIKVVILFRHFYLVWL